MCCDGTLFSTVSLTRDEVAWASRRRLPLVHHAAAVSFRQPCAVLEPAAGAARVCGDYAHRPGTCREFECRVLARYRGGELSHDQAVDVATRGRQLVVAIERRCGRDANAVFAELARSASTGSAPADPELLLDIAVLRTFLDKHFRRAEPEKRGDGPAPVQPSSAAK
jgi:hypothetical protein